MLVNKTSKGKYIKTQEKYQQQHTLFTVFLIFFHISSFIYISQNIKKNFKNCMAPIYGWASTVSRLDPLRGGSLLFTTKFTEIPGTHLINLGRMKGWVHLRATLWFLDTGPLDWESSTLTTRPLLVNIQHNGLQGNISVSSNSWNMGVKKDIQINLHFSKQIYFHVVSKSIDMALYHWVYSLNLYCLLVMNMLNFKNILKYVLSK